MGKGIGLAFLAFAAWSFGDACVKALGSGLGIFEIAFFSSLGGLVVIPLMARETGWSTVFRPRRPLVVWTRGLTTLLTLPLNIVSLHDLSLAEFYAIIFLMPIIVVVFSAVFLREPIGWQRGLAVALGFTGVLIAVRPGFRELSIGHLAAFGSVLCASTSVMLARAAAGEKPVTMLGTLFLTLLVGHGIAMLPDFRLPTPSEGLFLALLSVCSILAQVSILAAARHIPAGLIAPAQYSQIVYAAVFGVLVFNDPPDALTLVGVVLLTIAGLFIFRPDRLLKERRARRIPS
jgi:drug/metabolite transporter (DMT)-like permease